jgi:SAM-dependent methyltransferase
MILGEDFCGTAALSRAWCRLDPQARAVGIDLDDEVLSIARAAVESDARLGGRVILRRQDVRRAKDDADVIAVQNFSIGELHDRRSLVAYLRRCSLRLRACGCFACDVYDGDDKYVIGEIHDRFKGPSGTRIDYAWEHRDADPLTAMVTCAMHFAVYAGERSRKPDAVLRDAFVYRWRLWSVPELRDAMLEAGFVETQVFPRSPGAMLGTGEVAVDPIVDPLEIDSAFNVYVVGRVIR